MISNYKYDNKTHEYYFMSNNKVVFSTKKVALCYTLNEDDSPRANLLRHGTPTIVKPYCKYLHEMYVKTFDEHADDIFYFKGVLPVDDLNKIIHDSDFLEMYHPVLQKLMNLAN